MDGYYKFHKFDLIVLQTYTQKNMAPVENELHSCLGSCCSFSRKKSPPPPKSLFGAFQVASTGLYDTHLTIRLWRTGPPEAVPRPLHLYILQIPLLLVRQC